MTRENSTEMAEPGQHPISSAPSRAAKSITRVMSFTSGKGGVGKTNSVVNLAIALSRQGKRVLVLDADLGLANVDVLLGLSVKYTLHDVIRKRKTIEEIMIEGPEGISIIPAASGIEALAQLNASQRLFIMESIEQVAWKFDYLLVDTPAGIGPDVMFFNSASHEVVCVISSDPASLTDAYALIKILCRRYGEKRIQVVVNNVSSENHARQAYRRLQNAVDQFLHIQLDYLGWIPCDTAVHDAIARRRPVMSEFPSSRAGVAIAGLANAIDASFHNSKLKGGMQFFFEKLLSKASEVACGG